MRIICLLAFALFTLLALSFMVRAESQNVPIGPDTLEKGDTGRHTTPTVPSTTAFAGNVTAINLSTLTITRGWQGYYGNVTGTITLDDALNRTMYDWQLANPEGEVYASTSNAVAWDNVSCASYDNLSYHENTTYNFNKLGNGSLKDDQDVDGIDETFNNTFTGDFWVGNVQINAADNCVAAYLYVNDDYDATGTFTEVLLQDATASHGAFVFTSLLVQLGAAGYNGATHDFQMIVAEDGHNGNEATTDYYFYVELQ